MSVILFHGWGEHFVVVLHKVQSGLDVSLVVLDWDEVSVEDYSDSFVQYDLGFHTDNIDTVLLLSWLLAEQVSYLLI